MERTGKTEHARSLVSKIILNLIFLFVGLVMVGLAIVFVYRINIGVSPYVIQWIVLGIETFGIILFVIKGKDL